jgi:signal transduction histidine kinase
MHPVLSSGRLLAAYLAVWLGFAGLLAVLVHLPETLDWSEAAMLAVPICLLYGFVCLAPWYVCQHLPLQSTPPLRLLLNHGGAAIVASAGLLLVAQGIATFLELGARYQPARPILVALALLWYLFSVALHYLVLAVDASRQAAVEAREAELRALKSQIHPHFLFNSLNSIAALTATDPPRAREMAIRLSDFLRNTLGLGERESIRWREELELARTYLEVEQVRFGSRLHVEMNVDEACAECQVPPLVLQPLIENAIRHGIATMVEGGTVSVESRVRDGWLEVSVENRYDPESPAPRRHGHGLRNVRDRLETRFGGNARLSASAEDNRFRAEMTFPCKKEV